MAIPSHEALLKFADDVRAQEAPFNAAAMEAFASLFALEYRRLRAAQLESGKGTIGLMVEVRCNFVRGEVVMTTIPQALNPVGRSTTVKLPPSVPEGADRCTRTLRAKGKPYPRTCEACGLGPCRFEQK